MTEAEQIAAFLAKRGATRVPEGVAALTAARGDWKARVRGETPPSELRAQRREPDEDRITIVTDHAGREFRRNGQGEWL